MNDYQLYFPPGFSLATSRVSLTPLELQHVDALLPLTSPVSTWAYFTKELNDAGELSAWVKQAVEDRLKQVRVPFIITDKIRGNICGSTSYGNISFYDRRIEVGWTWLAAPYRGSGVNQQAKYALLSYAFDVMLFERVEIKTDNLNERAKQALRKIGAKEEGVLRSHMLMPHGRRRDSVYFSILKNEWPDVKTTFFAGIQ